MLVKGTQEGQMSSRKLTKSKTRAGDNSATFKRLQTKKSGISPSKKGNDLDVVETQEIPFYAPTKLQDRDEMVICTDSEQKSDENLNTKRDLDSSRFSLHSPAQNEEIIFKK